MFLCEWKARLRRAGVAVLLPVAFMHSGANAAAVGLLDGSSLSSTFEVGSVQPVEAVGWINELDARIYDGAASNGVLMGLTPYGNFSALFDTGQSVVAGGLYQLSFDTGFYATWTKGSAQFEAVIGTIESGVFTAFAQTSGVRAHADGNIGGGVYQEPGFLSGVGQGTGTVAVRLAQTASFSAQGQSDWFAFDNVVLTVATPGGVPEPASWALMIAGFGLVGATVRRRLSIAV